jgi:hypothetical protein
MTAKPKFITFTGADDKTNIVEMMTLSSQYPIEWGILFSPKRQGTGRYPSLEFVKDLIAMHWCRRPLHMAAHLCGADAREVIEGGTSHWSEMLCESFGRAQINTADPKVQPALIGQWAGALKLRAILQCRGDFPDVTAVDVLFDASGGRGISPASWPRPRGGRLNGYAGGLNPLNVADAVQTISGLFSEGDTGASYWIDMEAGVRNEADEFDLGKCRAVCEAVFDKALVQAVQPS